ncbi:SSU ribosomal protein S9p [Cutibacterium acnes JCM 18918]|nr:SSU ribosomal protein S9p [Cutibacterium acnes JCM 18918]
MTDTPTENLENTEVTPFTEGDREIAYRTDSNPTVLPVIPSAPP